MPVAGEHAFILQAEIIRGALRGGVDGRVVELREINQLAVVAEVILRELREAVEAEAAND